MEIIRINLEVAELGEEELIIGIDLFESLGYELLGVTFTWPNRKDNKIETSINNSESNNIPNNSDENGIVEEWKKIINLEDKNSRCRLF